MKLSDQQKTQIEDKIVEAVKAEIVRKGQGPRLMLAGAMTAMEALGHEVPAIWSIWIMSGRDVYQEILNSRAKSQPKSE